MTEVTVTIPEGKNCNGCPFLTDRIGGNMNSWCNYPSCVGPVYKDTTKHPGCPGLKAVDSEIIANSVQVVASSSIQTQAEVDEMASAILERHLL